MRSSKRATICFEAQVYRVLKLKATETGRSLSELVNDAVRRSLSECSEDLAAFPVRAREPNVAFETAPRDLKKRGRL
jgi:hypothetical protein